MGRAASLTVLAACLALALPGVGARASTTQESIFQDDNHLVYARPDAVAATLDTLKALGVERVRVSVFWGLIAPSSSSQRRPNFDATDPAAYPAANWTRYDTLVRLAQERGIAVLFNLTAPAPLWATGSSPDRPDIDNTYDPSPSEFAKFVQAVGTRYGGNYVPPSPSNGAAPSNEGIKIPPGAMASAAAAAPLPRVLAWSVWNEPNQPGWLTPQWVPDARRHNRLVEAAPRIYRHLVDAAFTGLSASNHGQDTILVGETAPKGQERARGETRAIKTLVFLRDVYCVNRRLRFLRGERARALGCPTADFVNAFRAAHPGLLSATAYAHHPYQLLQRPNQRSRDRDFVTIAELPRLEHLLDRILRRYGAARPHGMPLWLTEFGYQTRPPDPYGVSYRRQAAYLNEAERIAYRDRRVQALSQFLLVDDGPVKGLKASDPNYWGTFQSGLVTLSGHRKPAFAAYRLPIWVTRRGGRAISLWALLRPAPNETAQRARIQFAGRRSRRFRTLRTVTTRNPKGFLTARLHVPRTGRVRVAWTDPGGATVTSRSVAVPARR
jgi:hypothetical protein